EVHRHRPPRLVAGCASAVSPHREAGRRRWLHEAHGSDYCREPLDPDYPDVRHGSAATNDSSRKPGGRTTASTDHCATSASLYDLPHPARYAAPPEAETAAPPVARHRPGTARSQRDGNGHDHHQTPRSARMRHARSDHAGTPERTGAGETANPTPDTACRNHGAGNRLSVRSVD